MDNRKIIKGIVTMAAFVILVSSLLMFYNLYNSMPNKGNAICTKVRFNLNDTIPKSEVKIMEEIILTFKGDDRLEEPIFEYIIPKDKFLSSRNFERYGVYLDKSTDYPLITSNKEDIIKEDIVKLFEGKTFKEIVK